MVNGINPNAAIGAYQSIQRIAGGAGEVTTQKASPLGVPAPGATDKAGSISFAELLESKVEHTVETVKRGEDLSAKAITGEADLTDVVQAVTDAELTLQTLVAVRDKMISAYQDIIRMQI